MMTSRRMLCIGAGGMIVALLLGQGVWGQTKPAAPGQAGHGPATLKIETPPEPVISVDQFIASLKKESESLSNAKVPFQFLRPHPLVKQLKPGAGATLALSHLADNFTGDPARDTYIRYHLMGAILADADSQHEFTSAKFMNMSRVLPPEIPYTAKPAYEYVPPEIAKRYFYLVNQCQAVIGYPPFQKSVGPPDSFQYMDDARRKTCEAYWAEAKTLKDKFKVIGDPNIATINQRMSCVQWMLRQVRGDMIYGILMAGDPNSLDAVTNAITQMIKAKPDLAAELTQFFNAAYFDGWLGQYKPEALKATAERLKAAVIEADKKAGVQRHNFSELAFTVITAMENANVPVRPEKMEIFRPPTTIPAASAGPATGALTAPPEPYTAKTITLAAIDAAIERGVAALEKIRPPDTNLGGYSFEAARIPSNRADYYLPGQYALTAWAMLEAGESPQEFWLQKRIAWTACIESKSIYDRSMRLQLLGDLPMHKWLPWMTRDANWLISAMTDKGGYNATWVGTTPAEGYGDNANAQYVALALWAAERDGMEVSTTGWQKIDQYWRGAQFPGDDEKGAGWAVRSYQAVKPGDNLNDFANRVACPMTAAGVLSLSLSERYVLGPSRLDVGNKISPELSRGLRWLDHNFSFTDIGGDSDFYYYMWTIQNVGQASGYRTFNNVDWFREGTALLLNQQDAGGLWKGSKGTVVSTSYALAYLARARGPLAICKVRFKPTEAPANQDFDGWNNRPNDMVNLAEYMSRELEVPTSWQIADLDQPVYELIESTTLYLATDKPFTLSDAQVKRLREYIDAGGLLIAAPEGSAAGQAAVINSFKTLAGQLYPQYTLSEIPKKHLFYSLFEKIESNIPILSLDNADRPLMLIVQKDISRDLQTNASQSKGMKDAFNLLTNAYLFATGKNAKRARIATNYVLSNGAAASATVRAARIKCDGDFDPEPDALPQLKSYLGNTHEFDLQLTTAAAPELDDKTAIAFLSVTHADPLPAADLTALKSWIDHGGTLWIDNAAGLEAGAPNIDGVIKGLGFSNHDLTTDDMLAGLKFRGFNEGRRPQVKVIKIDGRNAVYVCYGDLSSALAGINTWQIAGPTVDSARGVVANSIVPLNRAIPIARPATTQHAATQRSATQPTTQPLIKPAAPSPAKPPASQSALPELFQPPATEPAK